jgi:hypothetical protein
MHGKKRPAEDRLETEQRLSKRLDLLNLDNGPRLYVPVSGHLGVPADPIGQPPSAISTIRSRDHDLPATGSKHNKKTRSPPADDYMQIEETPHRVYIHDLSAELSDIESDEDTPIFLSDIEKHIAKIPHHVLAGPELKPTKDNQLVLYQVPSSLTVPEEQDRVRRAIVETRRRLREKQASPVRERIGNAVGSTPTPMPMDQDGFRNGGGNEDPDAMDIDG